MSTGQGSFLGAAFQHLAARGCRDIELSSYQPAPCGPVVIRIGDPLTGAWCRCTGDQLDATIAAMPPTFDIYKLLRALEQIEGVTHG